jgi:radical SAM-linked protein
VIYLVCFQKKAWLRFLSPQEYARAVERTVKRCNFSVEFSEGFHPMPRISYIDPTPTGVIDLAFFAKIRFVEQEENIAKIFNKNAQSGLSMSFAEDCDLDFKDIYGYKYRLVIRKPWVLEPYEVIQKKKKSGIVEAMVKDVFKDVECRENKDYVVMDYIQSRERIFSPSVIAMGNFYLLLRTAIILENGKVLEGKKCIKCL